MQDLSQENIIKLLNIERLPDEQKIKIVGMAMELIEKRLFVRVHGSLPQDKQQGFNDLLEAHDQVALSNFINHNCPKFTDWITEEAVKVKQELSSLVKERKD